MVILAQRCRSTTSGNRGNPVGDILADIIIAGGLCGIRIDKASIFIYLALILH
jgi:hypothetical protein